MGLFYTALLLRRSQNLSEMPRSRPRGSATEAVKTMSRARARRRQCKASRMNAMRWACDSFSRA